MQGSYGGGRGGGEGERLREEEAASSVWEGFSLGPPSLGLLCRHLGNARVGGGSGGGRGPSLVLSTSLLSFSNLRPSFFRSCHFA